MYTLYNCDRWIVAVKKHMVEYNLEGSIWHCYWIESIFNLLRQLKNYEVRASRSNDLGAAC